MTTEHSPDIASELDPEKLELVLLRRDVQELAVKLDAVVAQQAVILEAFNTARGAVRVISWLSLLFGIGTGIILFLRHLAEIINPKG